MDENACEGCGARLYEEAEWCGLCFARVDRRPDGATATTNATTNATTATTAAASIPARIPLWTAEPPVPPAQFSRWREGTTTLGPIGRILTTIVVVGLAVGGFLVVKAAAFLGLTGWLAYDLVAIVTLKEIWKRDRVD
jgi:hypothetical protein